ncbi:S49 family peptidase [Acidisphaera sp. S103]|uniref:S49 family peptidase n=1 Tax=Acidisphaera sp. S103 TaxID=1747223 RepID=UPI00131BFC93|nr:S49 family peptidase [Acidisphaera sp. S103]
MSETSLLPWRRPRLNVIVLHGMIAARAGMLNADSARPLIEKAFASTHRRPVILDIESPGGSPVQSDLIATMIRTHADRAGVRVHAVIREVGASGGYWLACAADEIHANPMSIVGSIGVIGGGFGFPHLLDRLGIERRIYTAGTNKARLDPFSPEKPEDVAFTKDLMERLHVRFKDWVRTRRGSRLKVPEESLFDGGYMLGEQALASGLIDGFATVDDLVYQLGGDRARPRRIAPKRSRLALRLPRLAVDTVLDALEDRASRITLR